MSESPSFLPASLSNLPNQRWHIFPPQPEKAQQLAEATQLSPLLAQVLINRGFDTVEEATVFLDPESQALPAPINELPDLAKSVEFLHNAIIQNQKIAICGDYDADGMTSTALLMRSLSMLGADVSYAIPSRMKEGYGINNRIIEEFHQEGISLVLTVDNGISAYEPIAKARELGLTVIITDHHDLPPELPPAHAILNPKLIPETSHYRGLAGVGVAYVLAISLAQKMGKVQGLVNPLLELFTLGTIADLAALTGVNRRWVKRGLQRLMRSEIQGVQALIEVAGLSGSTRTISENTDNLSSNEQTKKVIKPEDIGFRLGPRINAVGRIADPQIVIELLTTENMGIALERAMQCEQINQQRQQLCEKIEQEAIAWCENSKIDLKKERVLVVVQPEWHHGVIGIVASRLVDRYGVPVFIGTYEEEKEDEENLSEKPSKKIRGSARGIPEFHVFDALQSCADLLGKFGGHKAAGGFSLVAENLDEFRQRLSQFAHQCLEIEHLKPLIKIDVQANLKQINFALYHQIDQLHPCGIENDSPIFWTPNVRIVKQQLAGKEHLKLTLSQDCRSENKITALPSLDAIAWRWGEYFPLPTQLDIAYKLRTNDWQGQTSLQLEIVGVRLPQTPTVITPKTQKVAEFYYKDRKYTCSLCDSGSLTELRIRNAEGKVLAIQQGQKTGLLGKNRQEAKIVDISEPFFHHLIRAACHALGMGDE
ncbi:single-stranded-DNA-specific exonuclease RecJ [Limnoraphis robusta]|uniref:Single-stranded-DNA-specific exonuclease RecJ n=1 Tax=Limnoraphis robusta CCNP1315 TaxID=3110306 RepID=A0ABU5U6I8_9CYAN|nr:single-stranded-DNA-specific exonuclease RecJ [Limnoraphis robusta]MEA5497468.1 single-stranded-DNA-specific exonuclease RecJ [Limnoraphis robusta BA-68 BA1]MEA5522804.1 single-stranded-DNA-specific exonuclease RecJ [Limnoraphis robusta CCNP1315]MEA5549014.1 single-stranded-DNA-specific exonuclease RecJ [Limnoraphis robusta CCNP1324]